MISGRFPQSHRLRKSSQFQFLSKNSNVFYGDVLFIVWKANALDHARLGITITKKFGDAHVRNSFKRAVREGFRLSEIKNFGIDIHVRPKGKIALQSNPSLFNQVAHDFATVVEKLRR